MELVWSKLRIDFDVAYEFNLDKVKRAKLAVDDPINPGLWIVYFYGPDEHNKERIVRVWFYESEWKRATELSMLREQFPHVQIE